MNDGNDKEGGSNSGGVSTSATPSIASLNRRIGISPAPRMLTRSEIGLLRLSKAEVAQVTREVLAAGSSPHAESRTAGERAHPRIPRKRRG